MQYVFPQERRRPRALAWLARALVRYCILRGSVDLSASGDAAALWLGPRRTEMDFGALLRSGLIWAPFRLRWGELRRLREYTRVQRQIHARSIGRDHWHLLLLGVSPAAQRSGTGGRLLDAGLARADRAGLPCYLETVVERNLRFFEQRGFRVVAESAVKAGVLRIWGLTRDLNSAPPAA